LALAEPATKPAQRELDSDALAFAIESARLAFDRHCEDVRLLDVRGLSQVCDYVLVASGSSDRQAKSVAAELEDLGEETGFPAFRSNRDDATTWTLVDFVTLVAHLFEPSRRAYYDLEGLWSDAPHIEFERSQDEPL
jgi:ribosome-associated protein